MSCLTARDLAGLAACLLEESDRAAASAHLAECAACRARRDGLAALLGAIGSPEPAAELAPAPATWDAIAARLAADETRVSVAIGCTYCKGALERADAVYCAACLAPHHGDCWDEHGACSSCRAAERVRPERGAPRRRARSRRPLVLAGLLLAVAGGGGGLAAVRYSAAQKAAEAASRHEWDAFVVEVENRKINVKSQLASAAARMKDHDPNGALADLKEALGILDDLPKLAESLGPRRREDGRRLLGDQRAELAQLYRDAWRETGDAWQLRETGEALGAALKAYDNALEQDPSSATAVAVHMAIARAHARMGRLDEALREIAPILEKDPANVPALLARGQVWARRARHGKAVEDYTRALEVAPEQAEPLLLRARARLELHEFAKAREDCDKALERRDSDWQAYIVRGRARAGLADFAGAAEDLTEAIDLQPSYPDGFYHRAELDRSLGKHAEAIKDYEVAITRSAQFYEAYFGLARVLEEIGDHERAAQQYEEVLKAEDSEGVALRAQALAGRARLRALVGRDEDARRDCDEALALSPRLTAALVVRARLALGPSPKVATDVVAAQGDLLLARHELDERPWIKEKTGAPGRADPELATVLALLGQAALVGLDADKAVERFEAAAAADPADAFAAGGLGAAWAAKGDSAKASDGWRKARELEAASPDHARGLQHANNADRSKKREEYEAARRAFGRAAYDDPFHALALLERARLEASWRAWDKALADATAALRADPELKAAYELRGLLEARDLPVHDLDAAVTDFTNALALAQGATFAEQALPLYGRALARGEKSSFALLAARDDVTSAIATIPFDLAQWIRDERTSPEQVALAAGLHELDARFAEGLDDRAGALASRARAAAVRAAARLVAREEENLGKELRDKREYTAAIARFDRAIALEPELAEAFYDRGSCYQKIGNFIPGILDLSRALELNPDYADQFYNKTYQVSYVVDMNRVITELDKIVADHPDVSYVVFLRGFFYVAKTEFKRFDEEDVAKGVRDFDRTLALNPKHMSAYVYRGFLRYKAKDYEKALRDYMAALELHPESGVVHFLISLLEAERGDKERAIEELRVAVEEKEFKGFDRVKNDKGFESIRKDPRVVKLLEGK